MTDVPTWLVEASREIEASPDTVWKILTDAVLFGRWMDGQADFEPVEGSPFRIAYPQHQLVVAGEVVSVDAEARRLGITWGNESGMHSDIFPAGASLLELTVEASGAGCRVDLRHSQLPTERTRDELLGGWGFHLSRMAVMANRDDLTEGLGRSLPAWFSAWNETDDETRLDTLRSCCAADVTFRDDWTSAGGVDLLSLHIANCFRFVPGWRIEATGDVRICRGEALVGWKSIGPDGAEITGHNHVVADPDGTIRRVSGFTLAQRGA